MNIMKTNLLISGILLSAVTFVSAATNDLTTAIQRGLFEEEANQNLGAAIQAYQSVANQFDKDRKLAATAIFRLGECYRKQGNTNDAATQYERILREFSDQPTLVTLSRQNLAALGSAPPAARRSRALGRRPPGAETPAGGGDQTGPEAVGRAAEASGEWPHCPGRRLADAARPAQAETAVSRPRCRPARLHSQQPKPPPPPPPPKPTKSNASRP